MTIDLSGITYKLVAVMQDGTQINLETVAENIAWEENESELAVRLNLTLRDVLVGGKRLASLLALCTVVYLYSNWGSGNIEVFRGTIWKWQHSQMNGDSIILTCYDLLYYLQKSQDSKYYAKNTKTKTIIADIFKTWNVTMGAYSAPDLAHAKVLYKNKTIASMLTDTLEDAVELGGVKAFIRATKGKVDVITRGENADVYGFYAGQNIVSLEDEYSMVDLVTRVVVVGKDDKNGKPKVEATLNGKTQYGILQAIHSRGDTKLAEAKKAAQAILDEKGDPKRSINVKVPEFPGIRKGDKVYLKTDNMVGYFYVKGISHNATNMMMSMEVEPV